MGETVVTPTPPQNNKLTFLFLHFIMPLPKQQFNEKPK